MIFGHESFSAQHSVVWTEHWQKVMVLCNYELVAELLQVIAVLVKAELGLWFEFFDWRKPFKSIYMWCMV